MKDKKENHHFFLRGLAAIGVIVLFLSPLDCLGQMDELFGGVKMSDNLETVKEEMEKHCVSVEGISIDTEEISFPLAQFTEQHLICSDCKRYDYYFFDKIVFTFSDGQLSFISAKGDGVSKISDIEYYEGYKFYTGKDNMVIHEKENEAFFLTKEGLHTNLFAWKNPYLSTGKVVTKYTASAVVPKVFKFGEAIQELKPRLRGMTTLLDEREFPNGEIQLNCFGMEYAGFPRKIEAKFNTEGKLSLLWILTAKQEESRLRKALIKAYGNPIFVNKTWEVFHDWQVSLRKDKPEVLVLSKEGVEKHKIQVMGIGENH
ncbi:hypothetical protein [Ulvibacterium marinum]|uniref:hypothetical protein n=1 Tax=Ulvibacterium marinum TaxID=2419782 RepID=UPI00249481AD|nr:hypothetical protein [Ulvibacterium marinum]